MALKFPSELSSRGTVKVTDKLIIHNIDTGATEYTTVSELLASLAIYGNVGIGIASGIPAKLAIKPAVDLDPTLTILQQNSDEAGYTITAENAGLFRVARSNNPDVYFTMHYSTGDIYAVANVSAASLTDRTPFFEGDALTEVKKIKGYTPGICKS